MPSSLFIARSVVACTAFLYVQGGDDRSPPPAPPKAADDVARRGLDDATLTPVLRVKTVGNGNVAAIATSEVLQTNERYWREETIADELTAGPLLRLKVLLLGPSAGSATIPRLDTVFTHAASVASVVPHFDSDAAQEVAAGVYRAESTPAQHARLDPGAWKLELDGLHAASARVRWALAKPKRVTLTESGASVELKLYFNRELPGGGRVHDSGIWSSAWERTQGPDPQSPEWRCTELVPLRDVVRLWADRPHFVDATLDAFQATPLDPRLPTPRSGIRRGVALSDVDADGHLDLVHTLPARLMLGRGDGSFEDASERLLGRGELWDDATDFYSVLAADFDRDGDVDLLMAGRDVGLVRFSQDGSGQFAATRVEAAPPGRHPASLSAVDVDGDGWLDVFVSGYGALVHPGPDNPTGALNGEPNQMLRGGPDGFENVTVAWGLDAHATRWTFIGAFGDPDDDGDQDLYVANDFGPNVLYRRTDGPGVRFEAELEDAQDIDSGFSMSATWADLDGDLDLDMYVSNMASTAAKRVLSAPGDPREKRLGVDMADVRARMSKGNTVLFNRDGKLTEADATHGAKNASWAWGTGVFDYDADGDLDIQCVNGFWSQGADDGRDL